MKIEANTIVTAEMINDLSAGDYCLNVFGQLRQITRITGKGISEKTGKSYACFYQEFGEKSEMSHSMNEGEKVMVFFGKNKNSK